MQDEDRSLLDRQAPEHALELVAIHDGHQAIRTGRPVDRQDSDVGRPCPATPGLGVAGMDDHLADPGFEAVWVAQGGKLAPDRDEGPLQGILGQIAVAQDPDGQRVRPVTDQLDQCPERLAIAALARSTRSRTDTPSLGPCRRRRPVTLYESVAGSERSAVPGPRAADGGSSGRRVTPSGRSGRSGRSPRPPRPRARPSGPTSSAAEPRATRNASDRAAAGSTPASAASGSGQVVHRHHDPAQQQAGDEGRVRQGERRLGPEGARPAGGPGRRRQPSRGASAATKPATDASGPGRQPSHTAIGPSRTICRTSTTNTVDDLRREQPGPRERRAAEPLQHAVVALVAGRDPEVDEAGGHDGQRQRARDEERERVAGDPADQVHRCEEDEHDGRDDRGHQHVLAAPRGQPQLHRHLGEGRAGRGRGGRAHDAAPRSPGRRARGRRPRGSRRPACSSTMSTSWSRTRPRPRRRGRVRRAPRRAGRLVRVRARAEHRRRPSRPRAKRREPRRPQRASEAEPERSAAAPAASSAGEPDGDQPAAVEDVDPVGQPLHVGQVVAGEQDRDPVRPQVRDDPAGHGPRLGVHARPSARRGSPPRAARRAPPRGRVAGARRRTAAGRASGPRRSRPHSVDELIGVARRGGGSGRTGRIVSRGRARGSKPPPWSMIPTRARRPRPARSRVRAEDADRAAVGPPVALDDLDGRGLAGAVRARAARRARPAGPSARRRRARSGRRSASMRPSTTIAGLGRHVGPVRNSVTARSWRTGDRSRRRSTRRSGSSG